MVEIYNELTCYHFAIILNKTLLFKQDVEIQNNMSMDRKKAFEIVNQNSIIIQQYKLMGDSPEIAKANIEIKAIVIEARQNMYNLRCSILNDYQGYIFDEIRALLEGEWRKQ